MSTTTGTRGRPVARLRRLALTSTTRAQHASHHLALLAAASATAIALMAASEPVAAQTAGNAAAVPAAEAPRAYDIPAGPLGQTLVSIGQQSGRTISVDPALVAGRQAPAVRGSFTPEQAAQAALAGSGLVLTRNANGVWSVRAAAPTSASQAAAVAASAQGVTLAEEKVTAQGLNDGTSEGTGSYTARSSSSATGLNLSLRNTPQSVTVITRQRMDDQAIERVQDALETTAGVSVVADDGVRNMVFARGFDVNNYQIDGVPTQGGWVGLETTSTVLYDRVELVRGPSGLLNGMGDPRGTEWDGAKRRPSRPVLFR